DRRPTPWVTWQIGISGKGKIYFDSDSITKAAAEILKRKISVEVTDKLGKHLEQKLTTKFDSSKLKKATSVKDALKIIGEQTSIALRSKWAVSELLPKGWEVDPVVGDIKAGVEGGMEFSATPFYAKLILD